MSDKTNLNNPLSLDIDFEYDIDDDVLKDLLNFDLRAEELSFEPEPFKSDDMFEFYKGYTECQDLKNTRLIKEYQLFDDTFDFQVDQLFDYLEANILLYEKLTQPKGFNKVAPIIFKNIGLTLENSTLINQELIRRLELVLKLIAEGILVSPRLNNMSLRKKDVVLYLRGKELQERANYDLNNRKFGFSKYYSSKFLTKFREEDLWELYNTAGDRSLESFLSELNDKYKLEVSHKGTPNLEMLKYLSVAELVVLINDGVINLELLSDYVDLETLSKVNRLLSY